MGAINIEASWEVGIETTNGTADAEEPFQGRSRWSIVTMFRFMLTFRVMFVSMPMLMLMLMFMFMSMLTVM